MICPPHRRRVVQTLAASCLASVLSMVPTLSPVRAQELQIHTEHVELAPRRSARHGQALAAHAAGEPGAAAALAATNRRSGTGRGPPAIEALGVTVPVEPSGPVLVRARVDGAWTPWFDAHFDAAEAPDPATEGDTAGATSQPIWLGGATAYEIDAPGSVAELDVHTVVETTTTVQRRVAASAAAGAAPSSGVLPRSSWGARPPKRAPAVTSDLKSAIVHHSVNSNVYSAAQVPALLRSMQAYHQDVQGWDDLAYNVVVDRFGRAWEGRAGGIDRVVLGGHSAGFNTGTLGVVALGDLTRATPPAATLEALARVIAWWFAIHHVDPAGSIPYTTAGSSKHPPGTTVSLARISAHRDVQTTSCPGAQLYARLGWLRTRVSQLLPTYQRGLTPTAVAADLGGDGLTDTIHYGPGPGPDAIWTARPAGPPSRRPLAVSHAYEPVVGDLDGNGLDDVIWHRAGPRPDVIWWSQPGGTVAQSVAVNASYTTRPGDFDGDGRDDVLWYSPGLTSDAVWYAEAGRRFTGVKVRQDLITTVPVVGDFDGDGRDDIFWYGPGTASDEIWWSRGRAFSISRPVVNAEYTPVAVEDATTGRDHIVMIQPGAAASYRWEIDAGRRISSRALTTPGPHGTPTTGDFDGDGREDVFVLSPGGGRDPLWYMTPTGVAVRNLTVTKAYAVSSGPMDAGAGSATDDLVLIAPGGATTMWRMHPDRTLTSTRIG